MDEPDTIGLVGNISFFIHSRTSSDFSTYFYHVVRFTKTYDSLSLSLSLSHSLSLSIYIYICIYIITCWTRWNLKIDHDNFAIDR